MEEKKQARIGFVGCGGHATKSLYPSIRSIPEFDLVAVCDMKQELAERNARMFAAGKWYTDLGKMLKEEKLDGAVICGPPQMHHGVGKQCLSAGLPIFVEKPSAVSYKDAVDLAEHARKKGKWGSVAFMKRYAVCYNMAKAITEKEEFGKIAEIEARFSDPGPYRAIWGIKENAKAFLIGQVIHLFDLIRFFGGEVDEVHARLNQVEEGRFGYAITVGFKNGVVGLMDLSAIEGEYREKLRISGYGCWLEVEDMMYLRYRPKALLIPEFSKVAKSQTIEFKPNWIDIAATEALGFLGYRGELENFAKSCIGLEKPRADLWDGANALQLAEAVWESATTGKAVKIS